jgi:hypothetical protein
MFRRPRDLTMMLTASNKVSLAPGVERRIKGSWRFNDEILSLKPCLQVGRQAQGVPADGCAIAVEVTLAGRVEISADEQYGLSYIKTGNE